MNVGDSVLAALGSVLGAMVGSGVGEERLKVGAHDGDSEGALDG
jgi:hypothetical protein